MTKPDHIAKLKGQIRKLEAESAIISAALDVATDNHLELWGKQQDVRQRIAIKNVVITNLQTNQPSHGYALPMQSQNGADAGIKRNSDHQ
jgi:hypothetical protein